MKLRHVKNFKDWYKLPEAVLREEIKKLTDEIAHLKSQEFSNLVNKHILESILREKLKEKRKGKRNELEKKKRTQKSKP